MVFPFVVTLPENMLSKVKFCYSVNSTMEDVLDSLSNFKLMFQI